MRPILKWAGGKRQMLPIITSRMPKKYNNYFEPFFGGGAVYFSVLPKKAFINDKNKQLINCYKQVRDNLNLLIDELDKHTVNHNEEYYYKMRELFNSRMFNEELDFIDAGLMIYLNKAGFNGMYRENRKGYFNIPSGKKKKVTLYELDNIQMVSEQLHHATIYCGDFEDVMDLASEGDFVFIDSPYYKTFDTYQAGGFTEDDHRRLADVFKMLTERKVYCMLTNSNTDFIKDLYKDFNVEEVEVRRMISWGGEKKVVFEVVVTNY